MGTLAKQRFGQAVARFEAVHREDPRTVLAGGIEIQWSLFYHRRLSYWAERFDPNASEPMRLAARCQHIRRWAFPRDEFPPGVTGYKRWRSRLAQFHAEESARILREVGYDDPTISRVRDFLIKKGLERDDEVQLFEDAICLAFLENELEDFSKKHDEKKLIDIIKKTWTKMSARGHAAAIDLIDQLPDGARRLSRKALGV